MINQCDETHGCSQPLGEALAEQKHVGVRPLSLRVNFSWSLIGNVVYNACQWGILSVFNKLGGTESAGLFFLGLTITTPITAFCSLQLRAVYVTDVKEDYRFSDYLGTRRIWNLIALVLCVLGAFLYWPSAEQMLIIVAVGVAANIQSSGELYVAFFQKKERMDLLAISSIIKGMLNLLGVVLVFWMTKSVLYAAVSLIVTRFLAMMLYDRVHAAGLSGLAAEKSIYDWDGIRPCFLQKRIREISSIGLPMGLTMLMLSLTPQIPRLFLTKYADLSSLGVFGSISYIMIAGTMLMAALGTTLSPRLARFYEKGDRKSYVRLVKISFLLFLGIGFAAILAVSVFGDFILKLLYNDEYLGYKGIFMILTCGSVAGFMASIAGYALTAARYFRVQPLISFGNMMLVFTFCALWIPDYGIPGAAWGVFVPSVVNMLAFLTVLKIAVDRCGRSFVA